MEQTDKLPRYIQLESTLEFSRLVCALERAPRVSFLHEHDGKKVLSVQMDLLKEKPVIYYTPLEGQGHYLCYGLGSRIVGMGLLQSHSLVWLNLQDLQELLGDICHQFHYRL